MAEKDGWRYRTQPIRLNGEYGAVFCQNLGLMVMWDLEFMFRFGFTINSTRCSLAFSKILEVTVTVSFFWCADVYRITF